MKFIKPILIAWVYLSVPIALIGLFWSFSLLYDAAPSWLWLFIVCAHVTVFLGLAYLIDTARKQAGLPPL